MKEPKYNVKITKTRNKIEGVVQVKTKSRVVAFNLAFREALKLALKNK